MQMEQEERRQASPVRVGVAVGLAALVLYAATCCRGVNWQDSGVHQYRILTGQVENRYGLALSHPLHQWIGQGVVAIFPGHAPLAMNLMSAVFGAVAIGLIGGLVTALTGWWLAGMLAGMTAGLAHAFWQMAVLTETYTLQAALLATEWCILLAYSRSGRVGWLVAFFAVNGLHVANHLLGLLALATYGVFLLERVARGRVRPGWLAAIVAVWLLGASPYLGLVGQHYLREGDFWGTASSALFGVGTMGTGFHKRVLNAQLSYDLLRKFVMFFGYSFPSLACGLAWLGIVRPPRGMPRSLYWVLLAQTAIYFVFVARYRIEDQYTFFLPVCALVGIWVGMAAAYLRGGLRRDEGAAAIQGCDLSAHQPGSAALSPGCVRRPSTKLVVLALVANALLPVVVYILFPMVAAQRGLFDRLWRDVPYRDEYSWFFHPWKQHDDSAERFARATLERARPGEWILADATSAYPIALVELAGVAREKRLLIYSSLDCVNEPHRPRLTREALRTYLAEGGTVLAVPSADLEALWGKEFEIVADEHWRRVKLRTRSED